MARILLLETSTTACSAGIAFDGKIQALREINNGYSHAENLAPFIDEVLTELDLKVSELDAVCVSKGPGSYTGLRIGVSTAKGIAYGTGLPLLAVDTLQSLAWGFAQDESLLENAVICPMIDARRMEVYAALFNQEPELVRETAADIIDAESYAEYLSAGPVYFIGPGAGKCEETLGKHPNAHFPPERFPRVNEQAVLAEKAFQQKQFEDVAYFEPFYLKDFVAGKPRKLL